MNLVEPPLTPMCKREVETISHLFRICEFSTRLWAETQIWCSLAIALAQLPAKIVYQFIGDGFLITLK